MAISDRRTRRLLATGMLAIAVTTATSAGVALAGPSGSTPPPATAAKQEAGTGYNDAFHAALRALVDDGTISQTQAATIREQGDTGTVDLRRLVRDGYLTAAQARAAGARLDAVKSDVMSQFDGTSSTAPAPAAPKAG